jgi:hypothetical protein
MAVRAGLCRLRVTFVSTTLGSPRNLDERQSAAATRRDEALDSRSPLWPRSNPSSSHHTNPPVRRRSAPRSRSQLPRRSRRSVGSCSRPQQNTTRESWATCTCPECGKSFRQEISVPDHGARIKAVETLLREGLGRVGEAAEPPAVTLPRGQADVERLTWSQMKALAEIHEPELIRLEVTSLNAAQRGALRDALAATA